MEFDFSKVMCNVFIYPDRTNLPDQFPEVFKADVFHTPMRDLSINKIIRYIVAVFDRNGLRIKVPDVVKRRRAGLEVAGFKKLDNGLWADQVIDMMNGKNDQVNEMIVNYIRMHKSPQYSYIMALEAGFYTLLNKTLSGQSITPAEVKAMRDMQDDIVKSSIELLNGEDNKHILEKTYMFLMEDSLGITPEDIAFRKQQGLPAVDIEPYGPGYDFEKYQRDAEV